MRHILTDDFPDHLAQSLFKYGRRLATARKEMLISPRIPPSHLFSRGSSSSQK